MSSSYLALTVLALVAFGAQSATIGYGADSVSPTTGGGSTMGGYGGSNVVTTTNPQTTTETRCTPVEETVFDDKCEAYKEKVCRTVNEESCVDVQDQTCRGVVTSNQVRQCFNVTEQQCGLKEDVDFQTINAVFTVQKCSKVNERVCDTVVDLQFSTNEDMKCINVNSPVCQTRDLQAMDKTCRTVVNFDCSALEAATMAMNAGSNGGNMVGGVSSDVDGHRSDVGVSGSGFGSFVSSLMGGMMGGSSGSGSGSNNGAGSGYPVATSNPSQVSSTGYGSAPAPAPAPQSGYGSAPAPQSGYGQVSVQVAAPAPSCQRSEEVKCYNTPRTISTTTCTQAQDKVCERVATKVPVPREREVCRNEEKKVCELEQRNQPKQIKNFVYTKQCSPVTRRVCESSEVKDLVPNCVNSVRKQCTFAPKESCEEVPKQFCFKVPRRVVKQQCSTVTRSSGGGTTDSVSAGYPGQGSAVMSSSVPMSSVVSSSPMMSSVVSSSPMVSNVMSSSPMVSNVMSSPPMVSNVMSSPPMVSNVMSSNMVRTSVPMPVGGVNTGSAAMGYRAQ